MRCIPWLVLAALAVQGCKSCRDGQEAQPPVVDAVQAEPDEPAPEPDPHAGLEPAGPDTLGLESPDPALETATATALISIKGMLMNGQNDEAREELELILEQQPGSLEPSYTMADLLLRENEVEEAVGLVEHVLLARYPLYAAKMIETPSLVSLEKSSPDVFDALHEAREASRRGWAAAMSRPGAFLLVAPPYPESRPGDPETEKLNRGWVVFLDAGARRFLPLTPRANVAGFILDRGERRLVALTWKSYDRETRDEVDEIIRPALLRGVRIVVVDLETFETSPAVDLGDEVVEARISIRSGHVLATVVGLDFERNEGVETSLEIDLEKLEAVPAAKAPPGPMDLIVSYGAVTPPALPSGDLAGDADSLPGGWTCAAPGEDMKLCARPSGEESVIHDLVLEAPGEEEPVTLAKSVGILQIDIL